MLTQEQEYQRCAVAILRSVRQAVAKYPSAFGYALCGLDFYLSEAKEIAIIGNPDSHEVRLFVEEIYSHYLPNKVVAARAAEDEASAQAIKLLAARPMVEGKATAYVCRNYACLAPATTVEELATRLEE